MNNLTRRGTGAFVCAISLIVFAGSSFARVVSPQIPPKPVSSDPFFTSGLLLDPVTKQPMRVKLKDGPMKDLPGNAANLPSANTWDMEKNQCVQYVRNDILRFNGALKAKGANLDALKRAHQQLGQQIYPPDLHSGDDWIKTGVIPVGNCRAQSLGVTRVLREYLKDWHGSESGQAQEQEEEGEEREPEEGASARGAEKLSELQQLKLTICQVFNPRIQEHEKESAGAKEESKEKEPEDEEGDEEDDEEEKPAKPSFSPVTKSGSSAAAGQQRGLTRPLVAGKPLPLLRRSLLPSSQGTVPLSQRKPVANRPAVSEEDEE